MRALKAVLVVSLSVSGGAGPLEADDRPPADPLAAESREALNESLDKTIDRLTADIERGPARVDDFSRRGDALFFRARFDEAVADYERIIELKPELEPLHWRLGLAYYYVGRYDEAARQFEMYFAQDDVDRENGIWRYFAHVKSRGPAEARKIMLKYHKPDRPPLGDVYRMCEGAISPDELLTAVRSQPLDEDQQAKQLFYAHLYAGLYDAVHGNATSARTNLQTAVRNAWPLKQGGYGPRYMWHIGRVQLDLLPPEKPSGEPKE